MTCLEMCQMSSKGLKLWFSDENLRLWMLQIKWLYITGWVKRRLCLEVLWLVQKVCWHQCMNNNVRLKYEQRKVRGKFIRNSVEKHMLQNSMALRFSLGSPNLKMYSLMVMWSALDERIYQMACGGNFYEGWVEEGLWGKKTKKVWEPLPLQHSRLEEMCCFWDPPAPPFHNSHRGAAATLSSSHSSTSFPRENMICV